MFETLDFALLANKIYFSAQRFILRCEQDIKRPLFHSENVRVWRVFRRARALAHRAQRWSPRTARPVIASRFDAVESYASLFKIRFQLLLIRVKKLPICQIVLASNISHQDANP